MKTKEEEQKDIETSHEMEKDLSDLLGKYGFDRYMLLLIDVKDGEEVMYRRIAKNANQGFLKHAWNAVTLLLGGSMDRIYRRDHWEDK